MPNLIRICLPDCVADASVRACVARRRSIFGHLLLTLSMEGVPQDVRDFSVAGKGPWYIPGLVTIIETNASIDNPWSRVALRRPPIDAWLTGRVLVHSPRFADII